MDREIFKMQINKLCAQLRCTMNGKEDRDRNQIDYLYEKYKKLTPKRLEEVVEYIINNHDYPGSFPLPKEFNTAQRMTAREDNYKPISRGEDRKTEQQEIRKEMQELRKKYPAREKKEKKLPKQVLLMKEMKEKGMVYSHRLGKWVHESLNANIGGTFSEPVN